MKALFWVFSRSRLSSFLFELCILLRLRPLEILSSSPFRNHEGLCDAHNSLPKVIGLVSVGIRWKSSCVLCLFLNDSIFGISHSSDTRWSRCNIELTIKELSSAAFIGCACVAELCSTLNCIFYYDMYSHLLGVCFLSICFQHLIHTQSETHVWHRMFYTELFSSSIFLSTSIRVHCTIRKKSKSIKSVKLETDKETVKSSGSSLSRASKSGKNTLNFPRFEKQLFSALALKNSCIC